MKALFSSRRLIGLLIGFVALYLALSAFTGIFLAEITLHPPRLPVTHREAFAAVVRDQFHAGLQDVSLQREPGVVLRAWYVRPERDNGNAVILLHGVADNRDGVAGYARMFLNRGYRVLLPDSRAHGESGGNIATYGVLEREDVHQWARWLASQPDARCVYGFGESMGAAIMLQATETTPSLCAVVAESAFSTFRGIAYDRFAQFSHLPMPMVRALGAPTLELALLYTRLRYGVDLSRANPEEAVATSKVPTLLIQGLDDHNIPPRDVDLLMRACGNHCQVWKVPGADHCGAVSVAPEEFRKKVLGFFAENPNRPKQGRYGAPASS